MSSRSLDPPRGAAGPSTLGVPRRLRLWPALVILLLQFTAMYGPTLWMQLAAETAPRPSGEVVEGSVLDNPQVVLAAKGLGPVVATLLLLIWWVGFSRAPWRSRILGPLAVAAIGWLAWQLKHWTMGFGVVLYALPAATAAAVAALFFFRRTPFTRRGLIALGAVAFAFGVWSLVRMDGVDGHLSADLSWRWSRSAEQRLDAERAGAGAAGPATGGVGRASLAADWPGFRGHRRDGRVTGAEIRTDWPDAGLPEIWRRPIGPGWGSFAVAGGRLFTQEQRGEHEVVTAYDAATGGELWEHRTETRFTEFISGVGPRATPTFAGGRLYTTGATGTVHCLDPATGEAIWTRDLVEDTGAPVPMWGFASSPLVHAGNVLVYGGAGRGKSLVAYDAEGGEVRWTAGNGYLSYSSAQLASLHGVPQVLMMSELGLASFDPDTGEQLWLHEWDLGGGSARIVQPAVIGNDVLIGTGYGQGTRRIAVSHQAGAWSTEELWTSRALKPYHNDFVVDGEHAFGFDGTVFTSVDLATGKRLWKRGRYGSGQVLLIADQKLLLVTSETGELVLLGADPARHTELARFQAIEGKTWNHPVVAGGRLFVRNGSEAASFDLRPGPR